MLSIKMWNKRDLRNKKVTCLLGPDGLVWVCQKCLARNFIHNLFSENDLKRRKYPLCSICVGKKAGRKTHEVLLLSGKNRACATIHTGSLKLDNNRQGRCCLVHFSEDPSCLVSTLQAGGGGAIHNLSEYYC